LADANRIRAQYERLARAYDSRWTRYINSTVSETLLRLQLAPGQRLLDVGCGTGVLLSEIDPGIHIAGIDLATSMLKLAAERLPPGTALAAGDVARLPFASSSFDVAVSTSSLHYWPDPVAGLREIARVLCAKGRLIVTDWCDDYIACWICDRVLRVIDPAHQRAYGREECVQFLDSAGFCIDSIELYKIDWLWGLMTVRATSRAGR
jgi:ubiquinone/menaquinone biosynthesis C-methylase UbiE